MSWKVHGTDEVFAALRGLCANSYRMYDPCEHRYYYDHECDAYECAVDEAAEEYERLVEHCAHQREQLAKLNERWMNGERTEEGAAMSITKELREAMMPCISDEWLTIMESTFNCIADRIDKEHAEAVADALQLRGEPDRWVELPVDADGVPIHVGDVMEWPTTGETFEVVGIGDGTLFYIEDGSECADWTGATTKRHHQPDSWERIIQDATAYRTYDKAPCSISELVERCRRLAGEGK